MFVPILLERDHSSLTVAWKVPTGEIAGHVTYEVEMNSTHDNAWKVLSSSLKNNLVKKKNLEHGVGYSFRYRFQNAAGVWSDFSPATEPLYVVDKDFAFMAPPTFLTQDGASITIQWEELPQAEGYALRFRRSDQIEWTRVDSIIKNNRARKKGLDAGHSYYFSILPVGETLSTWAFSLSSAPFELALLAPYFQQLLPPTLLKTSLKTNLISTQESLAGKVIGIYFSAHWCPPCRQFTPRLIEFYHTAQAQHLPLEILFCSADHEDEEFSSYYSSMPWLALPFDEPKREGIMSSFKVSGIPRLMIFSRTGQIIEENAVSSPLSVNLLQTWMKHA